jgi:hypothetical protein
VSGADHPRVAGDEAAERRQHDGAGHFSPAHVSDVSAEEHESQRAQDKFGDAERNGSGREAGGLGRRSQRE